MRRVPSSSLLFTAAALCLVSYRAQATTITSTTFSGWKTYLTASPNEADFTQIAYTSYNTSSGINLSAVGNASILFNFTGPDGTAKWTLSGAKYNSYTSLEGGSDSSAAVKITMPGSGENAVLLALGSVLNTPLTVTLSDGETFTSASNTLLGLSISHPISWLTVATSSGSQAVVDDFWYGNSSLTQDASGGGTTAPAPAAECATFLLMGGGLLILVGAHRKLTARTPSAAV